MITEKIKSAFRYIGGALVFVLIATVTVLSKLLKSKNDKISKLQKESAAKESELAITNISKTAETDNAVKMSEQRRKENDLTNGVNAGIISYNDLVDKWNAKN